MSASKQWQANKTDFTMDAKLGKLYNEEKYNQLYLLFDKVNGAFNHNQKIMAISRMAVEEISNIIENNSSWNDIKVRTEFNNSRTRVKIQIIYNGAEYFDPEANNVTNVIGSKDRLVSYERDYTIVDNEVRIGINAQMIEE